MARHTVIDPSGHTTFEFDGTNTTDIAEAERRFKKLVAKGFIPAERRATANITCQNNPKESLIHIVRRRFLFLP